jgi:hypothetical protein
MKTFKKLIFIVLALSMVTSCSVDTPKQEPDNSEKRDLLKSKLTGEWILSGEKDSYVYAFADNDTIYTKTTKGQTIDLWPYQTITGDSIRIIRNWTTTHNKVAFYSNDSIRIEDFILSDAAVSPPLPEFSDAVLIRHRTTPPTEEKRELTGTKWKLADIRNLATNELRTLDPYHHGRYDNKSFSFTFEDDTTGWGWTCGNQMDVNIKGTSKSSNGRYLYTGTEAYEGTADCIYFSDVIHLVDDCFFKEDQLIFAYTQDDVRYHLQFKQVKE